MEMPFTSYFQKTVSYFVIGSGDIC